MNDPLQVLLDFVEGRIGIHDFEQKVYNDSDLRNLLNDKTLSWHETYIKTNPFDYLINLNFNDPRDALNAQGAIEMLLNKKGISFKQTGIYSEFYNLLLESQPKWLDVDSVYLKDHILPDAGDRTGRELKAWLKSRLIELFQYHKKPPRWVQSPAWPIDKNGPMYFLGQLKIEECELFHDTATAFVFLDPKTGVTKTVVQVF